MGYTAPYTYGGYTYNRKDALVVKGSYYSSVNASSQKGSFSSNTTKYFYGYYTNNDGSSVKHPLGLMNYQSQNSLTFGFMDMSAIQSGGTARTFTVTFNANGGSTPTASKTVTYGSTYGTFPTPTRSNYRFTGWYTSASGGTRIQASNTVTITANQTLYAHWVAVYYLDLNVYLNGSIINDTNIFHCDVTVGGTTQASNVCDYYKQHDTGSSWSVTGLTTASGYTRYSTGTTSGTLTAKTNCTIYIGQNYTITYDRNGGTSGNSTQTVNYGTSWTTKGATCVKKGYTQTSWNTAKDGGGTTYNLSTAQTSTQSANLTLYAIYTGNTYYVKYDANGGSGSMGNTTHRYGTPSNLSANTFTKTGYTFKGWNTKADGSGTALNDKHSLNGLTATAEATVTIYAQWTENYLTVNYYSNNATSFNGTASGAPLNAVNNNNVLIWTQKYYYDNTYADGLNNYNSGSTLGMIRTGYSPTGYWGTSTSGGTLVHQDTGFTYGTDLAYVLGKSLNTGNASVDVYAQWKPNNYTITYNANGGYNTPDTNSSQSVTYNSSFSFRNRMYAFPGKVHTKWNTKADGSGTNYTFGASTTYTTAGDLTVYAQWRNATAEEQKIYLYNNGHCEALGFAKTSDWYGFKKGVVGAKDFTIGSPATTRSHTMQFKGMIVKNLT